MVTLSSGSLRTAVNAASQAGSPEPFTAFTHHPGGCLEALGGCWAGEETGVVVQQPLVPTRKPSYPLGATW